MVKSCLTLEEGRGNRYNETHDLQPGGEYEVLLPVLEY
jgi:hypothetical protein